MMSMRPIRPSRLGHAGAAGAVHADGVDLVEIGQRAELLGQVDQFAAIGPKSPSIE